MANVAAVTAQGASKLYDVWIYSLQDAGTEGLLPPDDPDGAPEVGPTAAQVAARVLEEELSTNGACIDETGRVLLACAIREHGTGGPWALFRAQVLALATSEVGWL